MTALHIAGQTDIGRHRHDNQDTFVSTPLWSAHDALLVVIDGVGGYAGGAQAAQLARQAIVDYMATPTGDTLTMLREAVVYANNQIVRHRQQDPALARMCCVLTAAVADAQTRRLLFVHVGDTRLYRLRQQCLAKLTHDHSLVGVREDADQLTEREAMHHPRRNEILRDVGSLTHRIDDSDFLESDETDFLPGDVLLLCSDGLTDVLTRAQLTDVLTRSLPPEEQVAELIRQANELGGQDNITVVLARFVAPVDAAPVDAAAVDVAAVDAARGDTAEHRPLPPAPAVRITSAPVVDPVLKSAPVSPWIRWVALFSLLALLTAVFWWPQDEVSTPARVARPAPVSVDSSARTIPVTPPDSTRTP